MGMTCDRVRELASGFVLGALDSGEMIAVSDHLDSCSKPHPEFEGFGGVLPYLAESLDPVEPPAWLRESVIAAAKADLASRHRIGRPLALPAMAAVAPIALDQATTPAAGVVSIDRARSSRRRRALTWATRIAAAVAVVVLAGYALVLQGDLDKAKKVQAENAKLNYMWAQPDTLKAVLTASDGSGASGMAALRPTGSIVVNLYGLVPTKGDEVYMVWLTPDNATPIKVGSLTVDDSGNGTLVVDNVPTSSSLWLFVCREPNGKVTRPTGPTVLSGTFSL
jgi:Anti-sigma-K factor rskA/Putative zinc-finger